jgi:uncharacterized protein (TIGR02646 family)
MRRIVKGVGPASLTAYRRTEDATYGNYADRQTLREHLHSEQRGLCCYCMGHIHAEPTKMKIEHWQCQSRYPGEQLRYRNNLLGACLGGERLPAEKQHCDTKKGDKDLKFNPAEWDHNIEQRIRFEMDGTIASNDLEFNAQLTEVLGLNLQVLKERRKAVLDGLLGWFKRYKTANHRKPDRAALNRQRERWIPVAGNLSAYSQVAIWWLDER